MNWIYDDGGRKAAGFRGDANDCVVRALAIITQRPYRTVYDEVNELAKVERHIRGRTGMLAATGRGSSARGGVLNVTTRAMMELNLLEWHPTMRIGSGCKIHLTASELPSGRLIASVSRHVVAVIDGVIHDTHDPSRGGRRCVYGYWLAR